MTHRKTRTVLCLAVFCLISANAQVFAARVSSQSRNGYQRTSFTFDQPAQLNVSGGGTTLTLNFSQPLKQPAQAIGTALGGAVKSATLSADGKRLMLNLSKPYRTRHFVSGNTVGIDFIGDVEAPPQTAKADKVKPEIPQIAAKAEAKEPLLTTKKPIKEEKKPAEEVKKIAGTKPSDIQIYSKAKAKEAQATVTPKPTAAIPSKEAEQQILTTKKKAVEASNTGLVQPAQKIEKPEAKSVVIESSSKPAKADVNKPEQKQAAEPTKETKTPAKSVETKTAAVEPVESKTLVKPAEAKPAHSQAPEKRDMTVRVKETASQAKPEPAPVETKGPFAVTMQTAQNNNILNFPYKQRTASAVFERGNNIWVIFSRPQNLHIDQLKSILPKNIKDVKQYNLHGNTVLRLTTDGSIHAAAKNIKNSYQWNIELSNNKTDPANIIPISTENNNGKDMLLVKAFDISPSLTFYDPDAGDMLLVTPSYESSHGVARGRNFPELSVLPSAQGIVIASMRDDVITNSSRQGLAIEASGSLALSQNLAVVGGKDSAPISGLDSGVLLPYDAWYVPTDQYQDTLMEREAALANATKDSRPESMLALATIYLSRGMGAEALGYLDLLNANEPEFYKTKKLALLSTAAHALENHMDAAALALSAPELKDVKEAELWREYLGLFNRKPNEIQQATQNIAPTIAAPAPSMADDKEEMSDIPSTEDAAKPAPMPTGPIMRFLKYNRPYIRFYPPRIRQMLVSAAADGYIANGLNGKALAAFDTLNRDEILGTLKPQAEYALALAVSAKKPEETHQILNRLLTQNNDARTRARARATLAMMALQANEKTPLETAEELEQARIGWHGDSVEIDILKTLIQIYKDEKQYDEALRSMKVLVDEFPGESDYLTSSGELSDFFQDLYLNGKADELPPLKALALFYEFKELTPVGAKGDKMIQKLADRLAALDLIDRATLLLENQINFRLNGEDRSRIGARLALLYLVNHQPSEALKVLEITNFGGNSTDLQRLRLQLTAQSLSAQSRNTDALNMIAGDTTDAGNLLRLDILWAAQDWPNVVTTAEDVLSKRADLTATLSNTETEVLLKLALGYSFQGDYTQLRYLRDYYLNLIPDSAYKSIFEFITNDTNPLDKEDSAMLTEQISHTESFLNTFKTKIANGKLSEAVK